MLSIYNHFLLTNCRPPGGVFTLPPPINGTNTDAASQERGGSGNSNPDGPLGANGPTANSTNSAPTQVGIASDCIKFAYVSSGDTCYEFTQSFGISMAQLTAWNPALGAPDGHNCTTQFWIGYDYCVGTESSQSSSSTSSSQTTSSKISSSTISLAYPTQSGISAYCKSYKNAVAGDYCSKFASDNGITTDELYAWNTILGSGGANCSTQFQAGVDYCVSIHQRVSLKEKIIT
jgi:LysM repeat protein